MVHEEQERSALGVSFAEATVVSGGYCAMSEHSDRIDELNRVIDKAIELLEPFVAGESIPEVNVERALTILKEVR